MNFKRYYYMMMSGKPIKESMPILVYNYDGAEIETDSVEKIIDEVVGEILKEKRNYEKKEKQAKKDNGKIIKIRPNREFDGA